MANFLTANKLKGNDEKTHLLVMTTRQKRRHVVTGSMTITTQTAVVKPSCVERLLGAQIHEDMRWREHIMDIEDYFLKSLSQRQGTINKISKARLKKKTKKND